MGGHRRDQSDSHVPLRPTAVSSSSCTTNDAFELQVRPSVGENPSNGGLSVSLQLSENDDATTAGGSRSRPDNAKHEWLKTIIAFLCLQVSAFLNFFLLTVIHDIVPRTPLPDLTFMIIVEQQRWAWSLGDVLSTISSVMAFTIILLHEERWVILRRLFLLGAIMYGLRAVVLGVTFLPPSFDNRDEICQPQVNGSGVNGWEIAKRFLTYVVTLGLTSGQDKILCGDLMFSGHTVVLTLMYFVQLQYTPRGLVFLRYLAAPITFCGIAALVVSGGHYTMDVLIAYWLTSHVFWAYHQMFEMRREERPHAPMSRLWWFWLCYWFESEVPHGRLRNRWDWPFSRPAFMHRVMERLNHKLE